MFMANKEWSSLTPEEKKHQLFLNQKKTLDIFLERKAISQAQYDKSLGDLHEKMGLDLRKEQENEDGLYWKESST